MRVEVNSVFGGTIVLETYKDGPNPMRINLHGKEDYPGHSLTPFAARILGAALIEAAGEANAMDNKGGKL